MWLQGTAAAVAAVSRMALDMLTRKHGFKISPAFPCTVEECSLAVAEVVGATSVKSAARMNGGVVIFVDEVDKANTVVANGVVIQDTFVSVTPLATPATKVLLSNIPPFINDALIIKELNRFGKVVSAVKKLPSGCKSPTLKHVVSHRRILYMILNDRTRDLKVTFKLTVDGFDYTLFATTENMRCFGCKEEGHLIRSCPEKQSSESASSSAGTSGIRKGGGGGAPWGRPTAAEQTGKASEEGEAGRKEDETEGEESDNGEQEKSGGGREGVEVSELEAVQPVAAAGSDSEFLITQEDSVPTSSQVGEGGSDGGGGAVVETTDVDMRAEEDGFKGVGKKRKGSKGPGGSQSKKVVGEKTENVTEQGEALSDLVSEGGEPGVWDSEGSDEELVNYGLPAMKEFLQKTKNVKGVKVGKYFPRKKSFVESAKLNMKKRGKGAFTDQEIYRVRKLLQKVNQEIENDENGNDDGEQTV